MSNRIHDFNSAKELYKRLVENFGPFSSWGNTNYPEGHKEQYEDFCNAYAKVIGATEGGVSNQIKWAITKQAGIRTEYVETYFRNKLAALEEGFIDDTLIPSAVVATL